VASADFLPISSPNSYARESWKLYWRDENSPMPVHMISPQGRLSVPKVRALLDFAVPKLRSQFARLAKEAGTSVQATRS
jgi:hypothetical protein